MFASQLIYTGCGKDKTGAFSVWSKTLDITKGEENEIRDKMLYKRPSNLPFEPTQEEIDTMFPKKFGYFYLSTGRVCLAQSVYIGNVYSDMDKRTGNYIIHAFVFDKGEDIIPMNFIESDLFKRGLTYQEWHEQEAPDELPKVEIMDKPSSLTKQEIDAFFDDQRIMQLKLLLQAILNASKTDQKVTFYDAHSNLKYWYKAISVCVPKYMQQELTFSTYFTPSTPLPSQNQGNVSAINTDVKIRNIAPTIASTIFNYQQDVRSGKYSFEFESGIIPANIEVSDYVHCVVNMLKNNIFNAIMLVDSVGKISIKCNVELNTALDIHHLLNKQVGKVDNITKLNSLIQFATDFYQDNLQDIADCLYDYGLKSARWTLSSSISDIYRFVFDYSEVADKGEMIHQFIVNQTAFGVTINAGCNEYCTSFKNNAPFAWVNFLDYIFDGDNFKKYFEANGMSFNSRYLIFDTFVESISEISEVQEQKTIMLRYFVDMAKHYIQKEQLNEVLSLIKCMGKCGSKWQGWIVEKPYSLLCKEGKHLSDVCNPGFTLNLAEVCGDVAIAKNLISQLISENEKNEEFIKLYVERYDRNASFCSAVFKDLSTDEMYATFLGNVELYRFAVSPIVTKKQLQSYYEDYFVTGKDSNNLFVKKLKQYLSNYSGKECINESLSCYDLWFKDQRLDEKVLPSCISVICDAFFSVTVDVLKEYISARGTQKIKDMLALVANNYRVPNHYYVITFGESTKRLVDEIKAKKKSPYVQEMLEKLAEETFYRLPKDEHSKDMFVRMYLPDVLHLYFALATEENFEDVYCQIFKPLYTTEHFGQCFYDELNKMKDKDFELILGDTVICACNKSYKFNEYLMQLVENILEEMGRGRRKKFFAQLLESVPHQYEKKTKVFIDTYQKEHESFLDKLFGAFGKKDDEEPSPKDKKKWKK